MRMNGDDIVDYAKPTMMAERALRGMHEAVLAKRYDRAIELSVEATQWCGKVLSALVVMQADEEARV